MFLQSWIYPAILEWTAINNRWATHTHNNGWYVGRIIVKLNSYLKAANVNCSSDDNEFF